MQRRVVVTGLGPVTPIGIGADALWTGLQRRRSAVGPVPPIETSKMRAATLGATCLS